jgi:hypothetical protein
MCCGSRMRNSRRQVSALKVFINHPSKGFRQRVPARHGGDGGTKLVPVRLGRGVMVGVSGSIGPPGTSQAAFEETACCASPECRAEWGGLPGRPQVCGNESEAPLTAISPR